MTFFMEGEAKIRKAEYAGFYYPSGAEELRSQIEINLTAAATFGPDISEIGVTALISPSGGFSYSSKIALAAYQKILNRKYNRVVLLGTSHFLAFSGIALSEVDAYETPLGSIPIDQEGVKTLKADFNFQLNEMAFTKEYSLEIQLPYLQYALGEFKLLPLILGKNFNIEDCASALAELDDGKTLFVLSTNLSHFHNNESARKVDQETINTILTQETEQILQIGQASALNGLALFNHISLLKCWQPMYLTYGNSSDAGEEQDSVVGYASFIYFQE